MYIMYILNVSVNELISFFLLLILCFYITDIQMLILVLCEKGCDYLSSLSSGVPIAFFSKSNCRFQFKNSFKFSKKTKQLHIVYLLCFFFCIFTPALGSEK